MATTYPTGDFELLERLRDTNNQQIRGQRQYGMVYDDGVAYEPDRGDSVAANFHQVDWNTFRPVADGERPIQPNITTTNNSELIGSTPWEATTAAPQWVETTTSNSTTPYPTREHPRAYRLLADGTLEVVEENGSAINPVEQPVQPYQPYPVLPYSPVDDGVVDSHRQLADKVDELTRTVELLQTALKRLERQQPDVEPHDIDKQPNRKLII